MRQFPLLLSLFLFAFHSLSAQMWNGRDTLYGNEWIDYDGSYFKIKVGRDGVYRLPYETLSAAGVPVTQFSGDQLQLFRRGEEVPIWVSTAGAMGPGDVVEFVGEKNRGASDRYLYRDPDREMLNPHYSLYTDTTAYYLTWADPGTPTRRFREESLAPGPAQDSYRDTLRRVFSEAAFQYQVFQGIGALSNFDEGEGYASRYRREYGFALTPPAPAQESGGGTLRMRLASGHGDHTLRVTINGTVVMEEIFGPFRMEDLSFPLTVADLQNPVQVELRGMEDGGDRYVVAFAEIIYARQVAWATDSLRHIRLPETTGPTTLRLAGGERAPVAYSLSDPVRREAVPDGADYLLPLSGQQAEDVWIADPDRGVQEISRLELVAFEDYRDLDAEFIIISHPRLIEADNPAVADYAAYRSSATGGGYRTAVIDVEQLFEQFGYGIEQHAQGLRNFGHFVKRTWENPRFILLLGRGYDYVYCRNPTDGWRDRSLVPTFGSFGSDPLLFSTNTSTPAVIPVGRVSARNPQEVRLYLEKLKAYEAGFDLPRTFEHHAWRKRGLHLVGGNPDERDRFEQLLRGLANTLESNGVGADVTVVTKTGSEAISSTVSEQVINTANEGVIMKTYLGHGSVASTGFGLDDPEMFDNQDRYMLAFSLGCLSGNLYTPQYSLSERFVMHPTKGAIGYVASVGYSTPSSLSSYTNRFYALAGGELYGAPVGEIIQAVQTQIDEIPSSIYRALNQQLSYHGDPALRLHGEAAPDYLPHYASLAFGPERITTVTDSVEVRFTLANIGLVERDTVVFALEHEAPDGSIYSFRDSVAISGAFTPVRTMIALPADAPAGLNRLRLEIDPDNVIDERPAPEAEANNGLLGPQGEDHVTFFVAENAVQPVYPRPFGVTSPDELELIASAADLFASVATYQFELDTTALFDSPLRIQAEVEGRGGRIAWQPGAALPTGRVYYWRVRPAPAPGQGEEPAWAGSSFLLQASPDASWNQSHFYQWTENSFADIAPDSAAHWLRFRDRPIALIGEAMQESATNRDRSRAFYDNDRIYLAPRYLGRNISFVVLDPVTGAYWVNRGSGDYGSERPSNRQRNGYTFGIHTAAERGKVINFLENVVPSGHIVVVFTFHQAGQDFLVETWAADSLEFGTNLFEVLEKQGATRIRELETVGTRPYTFAYQKDRLVFGEALGGPDEERVSVLFSVPARGARGAVRTGPIGPASDWERIRVAPGEGFDPGQPDSISIAVYGLPEPGGSPEPLTHVEALEEIDLTEYSANEYPYLRLEYFAEDVEEREVPPLAHWRVAFAEAPELALDPIRFVADTLDRGEQLQVDLAVHNFAAAASDSLTLRFLIVDALNQSRVEERRLGPVPGRDSVRVAFAYPTDDLQGSHQLVVELIADGPADQSPSNNQSRRNFFVGGDAVNPLLDVTFDGLRIMDGDLVSAQPLIGVRLRDDNDRLPIQDTSSFAMQVQYPSGRFEEVAMDDPRVLFFPAEPGGANEARVEFRPEFVEDGNYVLSLRASDASGNLAGRFDYVVRFEVVTASTISNVLPYPNPFSTATRFVYTMTGAEAPAFFMIQIFNASGQVVREVTQDEFGPMRIGTHASDFVWDGRDEYGDRLANGVYFYRVVTRDAQGEEFERRGNAAIDKYFRRDMGKIVILR